jgi:hypothetical protein
MELPFVIQIILQKISVKMTGDNKKKYLSDSSAKHDKTFLNEYIILE